MYTPLIKTMFNFTEKKLNIYICGPTVYADSHLGHARAYIIFDVLNRILTHFEYEQTIVMNITDIDDKIIYKFHEQNGSNMNDYQNFIKIHEDKFWKDMDNLGIIPPDIITRVTQFIPQIIEFIEQMKKNNYTKEYDGSIYYDSKTSDERSPEDFVLWKKRKQEDGNIYFPSLFGDGRPGWHIECSAMATSQFGNHIHIHGGGSDLKFPHHHNEELQVKAFYNKDNNWKWVDMWMHIGRLEVTDSDGNPRKMGKSLKNFITIDDYLKEHSARSLRLMFLEHDYKKPFRYNDSQTSIESETSIRQISTFLDWAYQLQDFNSCEDKSTIELFKSIKKEINVSLSCMEIHKVMSQIYSLMNKSRGKILSKTLLYENCKFILKILNLLGLDFNEHYPDVDQKFIEKNLLVKLHQKIKKFMKDNRKIYTEDYITGIKKIIHSHYIGPSYDLCQDIEKIINGDISELTINLYKILDSYRSKYSIGDFQ